MHRFLLNKRKKSSRLALDDFISVSLNPTLPEMMLDLTPHEPKWLQDTS